MKATHNVHRIADCLPFSSAVRRADFRRSISTMVVYVLATLLLLTACVHDLTVRVRSGASVPEVDEINVALLERAS